MFELETVSVVPRLNASWHHGFNQHRRGINAVIEGYENLPMTIEGRKQDEDYLMLATGLQMHMSDTLSFYLDYDLTTNSHFTGQMFSLGLYWRF